MATPSLQAPTGVCLLCQQRPADTQVYYDEVMSSQTTRTALTRRRSRYATRTLSFSGTVKLCGPCASRYESSVSMRKNGRRLMSVGVILLIVGPVIFALTLSSVLGSPLELVAASPVFIGVVLLGAGVGMSVTGAWQKQPMMRNLRAKLASPQQ